MLDFTIRSRRWAVIRILIADDHEVIRFGLRMLLGAEPDITVIGEAVDGRAAVAMVATDPPDIVLMDLSMPVLDGVSATREIVTIAPSVQVLVVTADARDSTVREAFDAGASGYVLKDSSPETLLDAIRSVFGRQSPMSPKVFGVQDAGSATQ
jgi:DNA-binding NarL/FixJ family response regulator